MVLYLIDQPGTDPSGAPHSFPGALMVAPNGFVYSVVTSMSRDTLKAWIEDLVLVK
jgi:hypothetical protein